MIADTAHPDKSAQAMCLSTTSNVDLRHVAEPEKKTAGVYVPYFNHMTTLTWRVMGSTTIPDEQRKNADQAMTPGVNLLSSKFSGT